MKKNHNVHGGTRKGASRRRKELALALCVSLWMAGGSVAGATEVVLDHQPATSGTGYYISTTHLYLKDAGYDALTIAGGEWTVGNYFAKSNNATAPLSGYSFSVTGGTLERGTTIRLYGISNDSKSVASIEKGTVNISGGTLHSTGNGDHIEIHGIFNQNNSYTGGASIKEGTVNISGGTLNAGEGIRICGISNAGNHTVTNGAVNISGGTLTAGSDIQLIGIKNTSSASSGGSVSVSGQWENGAPTTQLLSPGHTVNLRATSIRSASNGNVTLSGHVGFAGEVYLYGRDNNTNGTGNTLHIGTDNTAWHGYTKDGAAWPPTNAVNEVYNFDTIALHAVDFTANLPALTATNYLQYYKNNILQPLSNVTLDLTKLSFVDKNNAAYVPTGGTKNLLDAPTDLRGMYMSYKYNGAGEEKKVQLGDGAEQTRSVKVAERSATDASAGVTLDYTSTHTVALADTNKAITYSVASQADKLTFGNVKWKDTGALIDHNTKWADISFNGAAVDTTKIHFKNLNSLLDAGKKMTLVSSFGDTVGTITGEKYTVGTTLEGKGKASLSGRDLIFTAETGTDGGGSQGGGSQGGGGLVAQEQTHNAVMGAEVGMAALSAGNDFVGAATEGLSLASNVGADGVSSFAQMGGGSMRQETGSHVDTHTWNAILALGHQNKKERGTFEYGAFFEYGSGNYTTHNGDERGDGSMHYTGGGLLAKYTRANGVYVEGSLRAGSVHDDARNVLRDVQTRVPHSYETNAPYMGFHLGVGKEIALTNGNTVDVYGKYFYNRKNSVSFDVGAGDHYDLDAVTSQVVRVGARYNIKRDKWNFYAGAAYEHELDGKAAGTASNGGVSAPIRGADISGASFRGEVGATMKPGENSPWSLDLHIAGFAGKKQGFTGGVSVAFMF